MAESQVPAFYKEAVLRPLLKKPGLDADELKKLSSRFELAFYFKDLGKGE